MSAEILESWESVVEHIPLDLDVVAEQTGAIKRKRIIRHGHELLRMGLAHVLDDGTSLRAVAASTAAALNATYSDPAVLKRLRNCGPFAERILAALINADPGPTGPFPEGIGRPVRVIDASHVSTGTTKLRIHAAWDPASETLCDIRVTSIHSDGAESLTRLTHEPGTLVVGDRAHARAGQIHGLLTAGSHALVRLPLTHLALARRVDGEEPGAKWTPREILQDASRKGLAVGEGCEWPVWITTGDKPLAVRLVVIRQSPSAVARERKKTKAKAKRDRNRKLRPETLAATRYLILLTTLPDGDLDVATLGAIYRSRWQIETYFKRLKSGGIHLDRLRETTVESACVMVLFKLILAVLTSQLERNFFPPAAESRSAIEAVVAVSDALAG